MPDITAPREADSTRATVTGNVTVRECKVSNTGGHGILAQDAVDSCTIDNCHVSTYGQSISNTDIGWWATVTIGVCAVGAVWLLVWGLVWCVTHVH